MYTFPFFAILLLAKLHQQVQFIFFILESTYILQHLLTLRGNPNSKVIF